MIVGALTFVRGGVDRDSTTNNNGHCKESRTEDKMK
ncbi:Protein of unknown function [Pyronema omphalodes CBS 100304]|uniref:Uncharacterized protein n=1 Tax=Pyronema omphalodes (strain CBS 100304) TaxID=1076935 RepID=U4LQ57_PYROM|nr:Protein of unknown function [Pyronema omphalodes CBS 100304]